MTRRILLTSFDIWEPHHTSNAADDLLAAMMQHNLLTERHGTIRKLPVDFQQAPQQVIARIQTFQPDLIVCGGMAEQRSQLTVESNGKHQTDVLWTAIDVAQLVENLTITQVSHDAGNFVCNYLYYSVLKHIQTLQINCQCLFVHVPVLHATNTDPILRDMAIILERLAGSGTKVTDQNKDFRL